MIKTIGIIKETKNEWERRTPLIPDDGKELHKHHSINIVVQPSSHRIFSDEAYQMAGAQLSDDLSICDIVLGIKEIKINDLLPKKVYMYFSHTLKGQSYNMPMLKKLLDLNCTMIDYERIINDKGQRLIFFGLHAGHAGIIDSLWAYGKRLVWENISSPFQNIKQAFEYESLAYAKKAFEELGKDIKKNGLHEKITPLVVGITGYGNVSKGAQQLLDLLPTVQVNPDDLPKIMAAKEISDKRIYKVVFKEQDMVEPVAKNEKFVLQDYYDNPEKYKSKFHRHLPYLRILVNASYWESKYPKHVTKKYLKRIYSKETLPSLRVIGDISCDIEGGIECNVKITDPGDPIYTYDTGSEKAVTGFRKSGPVIMAVDNLPSELPLDASIYFSSKLKTMIPDLIAADYTLDFKQLKLPDSLKKAVIVHRGKLTPEYVYLEEFL